MTILSPTYWNKTSVGKVLLNLERKGHTFFSRGDSKNTIINM